VSTPCHVQNFSRKNTISIGIFLDKLFALKGSVSILNKHFTTLHINIVFGGVCSYHVKIKVGGGGGVKGQ
jgi:hypothetical protein